MNRKQRRTAAKTAKTAGRNGASAGSTADKVVQKAIQAARAGAVAEAEAALDEVLARHPDHVEALHHKGMILARGDRIEQGIVLLKRVVAAKSDESLYWNNLAAAQLTVNRPAEALPALENAVRLDPT
jgi:predicted Zn-dependent protease